MSRTTIDHRESDGLDFDLSGFHAVTDHIRKHLPKRGDDVEQQTIDFASARAARDEGMQRALDAAERRDSEWPEMALAFLRRYALAHEYFTTEDVTREATQLGYGSPSDDRAWGSVVRRAVVRGIIANTHTTRPRMKGHGSPGIIWASQIYSGDIA